MQKIKSLLLSSIIHHSNGTAMSKHQTEYLDPEIGFQISIGFNEKPVLESIFNNKTIIEPELQVHLIAARHLPALFSFKIVKGYLIKVKLFPGSKRLDSSIQTNSWPKFNEYFRFPLTPDLKQQHEVTLQKLNCRPSLKYTFRRGKLSNGQSQEEISELTPVELFSGQFVVFTVYALLELPSTTTFHRFSRSYRSLKDKSSNLMQNIFDTNGNKSRNNITHSNIGCNIEDKTKRKYLDNNIRDTIPALTLSESRRNLGSVTCYLEPKMFKHDSRNIYTTDELWLPIKDLTMAHNVSKNNHNTGNNGKQCISYTKNNNNSHNTNYELPNAPKGIVELILELQDRHSVMDVTCTDSQTITSFNNCSTDSSLTSVSVQKQSSSLVTPTIPSLMTPLHYNVIRGKESQAWQRMTWKVKRKMGISNNNTKQEHGLFLCITTSRMRCSHKAKDELEHTTGSVYVKTTVFEYDIFIDSRKSSTFCPSLSTKLYSSNETTQSVSMTIPIENIDSLDHIVIKTTLAAKTKMGKKLVLGTVLLTGATNMNNTTVKNRDSNHSKHIQRLREAKLNKPVSMWHCYQ